jgi:cytochrome b subunit of formate dehydrogenase
VEKAEYWALIWGTMLMGLTGIILWFENTSMGLLTKLGFDISRTVHFYEAILATLAIIVWHFYFVIFNPDVYPMNLAWLTGRVSEREMQEDHPLELEQLKKEGALPEATPPGAPSQKPGDSDDGSAI